MGTAFCLMDLNEFNKVAAMCWWLPDDSKVRVHMVCIPWAPGCTTRYIWAAIPGTCFSHKALGVLFSPCDETTDFRAGDLRWLCREMARAARAAGDLPGCQAVYLTLGGPTLKAWCCDRGWRIRGQVVVVPPRP